MKSHITLKKKIFIFVSLDVEIKRKFLLKYCVLLYNRSFFLRVIFSYILISYLIYIFVSQKKKVIKNKKYSLYLFLNISHK